MELSNEVGNCAAGVRRGKPRTEHVHPGAGRTRTRTGACRGVQQIPAGTGAHAATTRNGLPKLQKVWMNGDWPRMSGDFPARVRPG